MSILRFTAYTDLTLIPKPPTRSSSIPIFTPSRSFTGTSSNSKEHGFSSKHSQGSSSNSTPADLISLSYVILDNHISEPEALMLLGRLVANIQKPLQNYVPTFPLAADVPPQSLRTPSQYSFSSSSTVSSRSTIVEPTIAQNMFPHVDPSIFILPNLPISQSESTTATVSHTSSYSAQTQSILTALLGLSLSSSSRNSRTFNLTAKTIRTLSLTQHAQVFAELMRIHGPEVKKAVKDSGGTMFFVIGAKIATDATVESRNERGKCQSGKIEIDVAHGMGINSGVRGVGRIRSDIEKQREWENVCTEKVDGDRAFAMEYCPVKLQRKIEFVKRDEEHKKMKEMAAEARRELERDFSRFGKEKLPIGETVTEEGKKIFIYPRDLEKLKMEKGDAVWERERRYKWLKEIVNRAENLTRCTHTSLKYKDEDTLDKELEQEQAAIIKWDQRDRKLVEDRNSISSDPKHEANTKTKLGCRKRSQSSQEEELNHSLEEGEEILGCRHRKGVRLSHRKRVYGTPRPKNRALTDNSLSYIIEDPQISPPSEPLSQISGVNSSISSNIACNSNISIPPPVGLLPEIRYFDPIDEYQYIPRTQHFTPQCDGTNMNDDLQPIPPASDPDFIEYSDYTFQDYIMGDLEVLRRSNLKPEARFSQLVPTSPPNEAIMESRSNWNNIPNPYPLSTYPSETAFCFDKDEVASGLPTGLNSIPNSYPLINYPYETTLSLDEYGNAENKPDIIDTTNQSTCYSGPSPINYTELISCPWSAPQPEQEFSYFSNSFFRYTPEKKTACIQDLYNSENGQEEDEYEIELGAEVITEVYNGDVFDGRPTMDLGFMG